MIRFAPSRLSPLSILALVLFLGAPLAPIWDASAQDAKKDDVKTKTKPAAKTSTASRDPKAKATDQDTKTAGKKPDAKSSDSKATAKPVEVATYGDWGAFLAQGTKDKTCYALARPKDRAPATLKRDPAYVFISSRPGENVRNEVSIIMGFPMKDNGEARAEIAGTSFDLLAKGTNAWVKNPAEEAQFIDALKKGSKLVVRAPSIKGNVTTDSYSLAGLSQALDRVRKECP
jgi:hypothetical protein